MSQACDGYSANCLMGKERLIQATGTKRSSRRSSPSATKVSNAKYTIVLLKVRGIDPNISFADAFGNLLPLERIKRAQPWSTEGLICDFGKVGEVTYSETNSYYNEGHPKQHEPRYAWQIR
jgi:hypothetical protein